MKSIISELIMKNNVIITLALLSVKINNSYHKSNFQF